MKRLQFSIATLIVLVGFSALTCSLFDAHRQLRSIQSELDKARLEGGWELAAAKQQIEDRSKGASDIAEQLRQTQMDLMSTKTELMAIQAKLQKDLADLEKEQREALRKLTASEQQTQDRELRASEMAKQLRQTQTESGQKLVVLNQKSASLLAEGLKEKDRLVRRWAAEALGKMGTNAKSALPALINAMKDEDEGVRKEATEAVKRIEPDEKEPSVESGSTGGP